MKKMSFMRMAALMLLLCLASTCAISGTFAKYTSTATGSDNARVAKWGWDTTTLAVDMFDTEYATDVESGDATNVIAPGTTATKTITIRPDDDFKPEVAYSVSIAVDSTGSDSDLLAKLKWKINGEAEWLTFAELQTKVAAESIARIEPGATVDDADKDISITWEWPFYVDDATDEIDTDYGNEDPARTVVLNFTLTVTQVND